MRAPAPTERHAIARLRERFGVELSHEQLAAIEAGMADPATRHDPARFRFVSRFCGENTRYLVNLGPAGGPPLWVLTVYVDPPGRIVTVYPAPANLTVAQADRWLTGNAARLGRAGCRRTRRGHERARARSWSGG